MPVCLKRFCSRAFPFGEPRAATEFPPALDPPGLRDTALQVPRIRLSLSPSSFAFRGGSVPGRRIWMVPPNDSSSKSALPLPSV